MSETLRCYHCGEFMAWTQDVVWVEPACFGVLLLEPREQEPAHKKCVTP